MSEYLNEDICQFSNDASASSFGWNFQANAGIFLFLKYMPDAADIKIESMMNERFLHRRNLHKIAQPSKTKRKNLKMP